MVEKVSINVKVVSLHTEHNFLIPWEMGVKDATQLIVQTLQEEYPSVKHSATDVHLLMQLSSGKILDAGCSFKQLGIIQGESLLLI